MKKLFSLSIMLMLLNSGCQSQTATNPTTPSSTTNTGTFFKVKAIVQQRCTTCHAVNASDPSSGSPASGIALETDTQIINEARAIKREVVDRRTMPYQNNKTVITEAERTMIGAWVDAGASTN